MLLLLAFVVALVAVVVGYLAYRRIDEDEDRNYLPDLDDHTYDVDLDSPQRQEYTRLLELEKEGTATPNMLMVSLLNRAAAILPYVEMVERDRPRLHKLHRHSYVPTNVVDELTASEFELQHEVEEVRAEAERLKPGWGSAIFPQAWQLARKRREAQIQMAAQGRAPGGGGNWSQSNTHMSLGLPLPPNIRPDNVLCNFEKQAVIIVIGSHNPRRLDVEQEVKPDECSWTVREDNTLQIVLAKKEAGMWKAPHKTS
jgi:hypothetical protein